MRVMHIITRMIIGGAQENTLYNCLDLAHDFGDEVLLVTGPEQGPEGGLLEQGRAGGLKIETCYSLRRNIEPITDWRAYRSLLKLIAQYQPDVVHTHSAKGGMLGRMAAWKQRVPAIVHTVHGAPFHPYQSRRWPDVSLWLRAVCCRALPSHDQRSGRMTELMVNARVAPREKFTTIY